MRIKITPSALLQILRRSFPNEVIEIYNANSDSDVVRICVDSGDSKTHGLLDYNFKTGFASAITVNWQQLFKSVFERAGANYERRDRNEPEPDLFSESVYEREHASHSGMHEPWE